MFYRLFLPLILIGSFLINTPVFAQAVGAGDDTSTGATVDENSGSNKNQPPNNSNGNNPTMGPGGNNQVVSSRDAIGFRIVPNPEHLSPLNWYSKNIKVKGSPQSITVDGYEAVRDGRTVYVSAAKIVSPVNRCSNDQSIVCTNSSQCADIVNPGGSWLPRKFMSTVWAAGNCASSSIPELFTNIYIISYNQNPENMTTDIFGQILQYWKFNIDIKNCSKKVTQACDPDNNNCPVDSGNKESCGSTGWCSDTKNKTCIIDADCPQGEYCNSKKSSIIRDVKRLAVLGEVKSKLENYNRVARTFPKLESGTYLNGRTLSTWPSWSATFSTTIGSAMPTDQINKVGLCKIDPQDNKRFDPITCWDENNKEFAGSSKPFTPPAGSHVYYYHYNPERPNDNAYKFCAVIESGYIAAKAPNSEYCIFGRACNVDCSNRQCGDNGCGGTCGTCPNNQTCQNGHCRSVGSVYQE